jgi:hypothetical protein
MANARKALSEISVLFTKRGGGIVVSSEFGLESSDDNSDRF